MSNYFFGLHAGHYDDEQQRAADQVEREFGDDRVAHTNYTEPNGTKRGWWSCRNCGFPFGEWIAKAVLARFAELCDEHDEGWRADER